MITILTKNKKNKKGGKNKGVKISLCAKNRIAVNFNREITKLLPEYMNIGYEDNKLYFLDEEYGDGYKVIINNGVGRLCFIYEEKNLNILKQFIGNHQIQSGNGHIYIEIPEVNNETEK